MRRGNGTAVGAEQQLARHPGTVFGVFPAFKLCHSTPQQTQLCALQPSIWEQSEAGGFTGSSPTVVLGVHGEKVYKPLITQSLFRLQQPCAPYVVEARWGPHVQTLPVTDTGVVQLMAGDKCVPPGRICLHPMAAGGREHRCSARAAWRSSSAIWFLLPEGLRHHWHPLEH